MAVLGFLVLFGRVGVDRPHALHLPAIVVDRFLDVVGQFADFGQRLHAADGQRVGAKLIVVVMQGDNAEVGLDALLQPFDGVLLLAVGDFGLGVDGFVVVGLFLGDGRFLLHIPQFFL